MNTDSRMNSDSKSEGDVQTLHLDFVQQPSIHTLYKLMEEILQSERTFMMPAIVTVRKYICIDLVVIPPGYEKKTRECFLFILAFGEEA